ncbi:hypothetical protein SAMN05444421_104242 [Celeribacter marinus]|nr:hypothetical protein SAMN05444421_104242 [Celeribacter marinus]
MVHCLMSSEQGYYWSLLGQHEMKKGPAPKLALSLIFFYCYYGF